jgi:predicted esterase
MIVGLILFAALFQAPPPSAGVVATGLHEHVVFDENSPLSRSTELMRRLLTPLAAMAIDDEHRAMREQPLDPAREAFALYVPSQRPANGYALLVFVPPWPQASVPAAWRSMLDRNGMIFVSAERSGNDADVLDRREPLALMAAYNVMHRYTVDPQRVFVGGFSGGSRVALRLALGYPDLFHGALMAAGSDPIGSVQIPLPPAPLFQRFRQSSRLVYLTGKQDTEHLAMDERSRDSLHHWCVAAAATTPPPWSGHELPPASALGHALRMLERPAPPDTSRLADCRVRLDRDLATQLQKVRQLIARHKTGQARTLLDSVDARYGGLAAPQSVQLAHSIATRAPAAPH